MIARRAASSAHGMSRTPDNAIPLQVSSPSFDPLSAPSDSASTTASTAAGADWWADRHSILLLVALYTAQGLPMGLAFGSIPFLLKERGSSYADLAQFSFASLPYSLKLFIAPIVDSLYVPAFGRRKSWIVPVQLAIGSLTMLLARSIHQWVMAGDVVSLLPTFIALMSLTATQDIAVDGWSLTMLRKDNVAYASTCQSFGLSIGFFSTFTIFLAFSSAEFCDAYVRPLLPLSNGSGQLIDLQGALTTVGAFYILLTMYVAIAKREVVDSGYEKKADVSVSDLSLKRDGERDGECDEASEREAGRGGSGEENVAKRTWRERAFTSIATTYSDLFVAVKLPAVQSLVICLLLAKVGMSSYDSGAFFDSWRCETTRGVLSLC